jgi:hypothetical protein
MPAGQAMGQFGGFLSDDPAASFDSKFLALGLIHAASAGCN